MLHGAYGALLEELTALSQVFLERAKPPHRWLRQPSWQDACRYRKHHRRQVPVAADSLVRIRPCRLIQRCHERPSRHHNHHGTPSFPWMIDSRVDSFSLQFLPRRHTYTLDGDGDQLRQHVVLEAQRDVPGGSGAKPQRRGCLHGCKRGNRGSGGAL